MTTYGWEGTAGLALHWPCVTRLSALSIYGRNGPGLVKEMSIPLYKIIEFYMKILHQNVHSPRNLAVWVSERSLALFENQETVISIFRLLQP